MSEIRVSTIVNEANTDGPVLAGITSVTATTQSTSTTTGAFVVSGGVGIAKSLNVGGNVTVGGTLTYEDVTNIDSVGFITARKGLTVTGVATATQFVGILTGGTSSGATVGVGTTSTILDVSDGATQNRFGGVLLEKVSIQAAKLADTTVDLAQGNVHYFTTNGTGATTAAIIYKGGNNVSTFMNVGDNVSVSIISKPNNAEYINAVTIDGAAVTEEWLGGSTPSSASGSGGYTITTINITKIANTGTDNDDFLVLCSVNNYA